jgi:hypothetical protein
VLGKFFLKIHWVLFIIFVSLWLYWIFSLYIGGGGDLTQFLSGYVKGLLFQVGVKVAIIAGLTSWIPVLFLLVDYFVNGKWTWLPWKRN